MTSRFESQERSPTGFALVITLIMVVLAAVIVIAMISSASLERVTAKSVNDRLQAEIAVQNGLEAAKKALVASPGAGAASVIADDTFLVLRAEGSQPANSSGNKDAYYFTAKPRPGAANTIDCYPLFSGDAPPTPVTITINPTTYVVTAPPAPTPFPKPAQEIFGSTVRVYPQLLPFQQSAYTQWQEIRDPNDTAVMPAHDLPYQRYTFWVEDLAGYIDAGVAGNTAGPSSSHARPINQSSQALRYRTTPAELAMFTLFSPAATIDPGNTGAQDLVTNRALLLTGPTLRQLAPGPSNADITTPSLAARLKADSELPLVPLGFRYMDEGNAAKPRLDLNAQILIGGNAAVDAIAAKINDNLPTFGPQRKGGLAGLDYVKTIAASIIDYADSDSAATVGTDYHGYDSYPLVNEIFSMKWWKGTYLNSFRRTYFVEVSMDTWVELWNPSNQTVTGTASIDILENLPVEVGNYTYTFGTKPADLLNNSTVATTYPSAAALLVNMQPNEYATYHVRTDVFQFNSGVSPPLLFPPVQDPSPSPAPSPHKLPLSYSLTSNYEMRWSAGGSPTVVVDKAGGGIQRLSGGLDGPNNYTLTSHKRWSGSYPGFTYTDTQANLVKYTNPGDPRAAFYLGRPNPATPATPPGAQAAVAYDTASSFWVRNNRPNLAPTAIYYEVKSSSWPDRGHESTRVTATPTPSAVADPPTGRPAGAATASSKAPAAISNAGFYSTTAELGNIYDPMQWNIIPDASNRWNDVTAITVADANYGGGISLRIGRPEFSRFDQPHLRAWQLLDLFQAGARVNTRGLVNINTASRDVLRALGAGLLLNRDSDISFVPNPSPSPGFYPPFISKQADVFADAVIAGRPFLSPAQLSAVKIASSSTPLFGNPAAWTTSPPSEWNDSGTEEYFAKIFPLTTVRSRNFRVFATGQSLDKNGKVLSTVSKVFQIYLNPTRDNTGAITKQNAEITYESQLPL